MPKCKILFLNFLFLFCFRQAISQNNSISYTTGYIIFSNHDTVHGKLALLTEEEACEKIEFLDSSGNKLNNLSAETVVEYKRGNDLFFSKEVKRPNWLGKKKFFVKLIESGKVNLYKFSFERNSPGGFIDYGNGNKGYYSGNSQKTFEFYLQKNDQVLKRITELNQTGDLWSFFKGDDEMVKKVRKTKIEYVQIPPLIKDYNNSHN